MLVQPPRWISSRIRPFAPEEVTSKNRDAEVNPHEVGLGYDDIETIWSSVLTLYKTGLHPAIALCVRRHGQIVIDRAVGHLRGNAPTDPRDVPLVPIRYDSLFNFFSGSKAVTAMLIHLLDERGQLHLDDR